MTATLDAGACSEEIAVTARAVAMAPAAADDVGPSAHKVLMLAAG